MKANIKKRQLRKKERSIAVMLTAAMVFCTCFQCLFLTVMLLTGGLLKETKMQSYTSLSEKVAMRLNYVQNEITYRWMNNALLMNERLSEYLNQYLREADGEMTPENVEKYLGTAVPLVISAMRNAEANEGFVILDKQFSGMGYDAVYLHDESPDINTNSNSDIAMMVGPDSAAEAGGIKKDSLWQYKLFLEKEGRNFYDYPLSNVVSRYPAVSGYWSLPFRIMKNGNQVISYTLPLLDKTGKVWGVSGIAVSVPYFMKLLPETEISARDSLGYMLAYKKEDGKIYPAVMGSRMQESFLYYEEPIDLTLIDETNSIYGIEGEEDDAKIFAVVKKIQISPAESPYREQEWYIIGLIKRENLFSLYRRVQNILIVSIGFSIFAAVISGILTGQRFTAPIRRLAGRIREQGGADSSGFEKSPYRELNNMTAAIEHANKKYIENTSRFMQILNSTNLPLGIFSYSTDKQWIYVPDFMVDIMIPSGDENERREKIREFKSQFPEWLERLRLSPVQDEPDVYCIGEHFYVKIHCFENGDEVFGIAEDVTDTVLEKERIRRERDCDYLTALNSRSRFERDVKAFIAGMNFGTAAIIMLDVDNFKRINDTYGHGCGDNYLRAVAEQLRRSFSENAILGRRSGDEFLVFLYGQTSEHGILDRLEEFYDGLEKNPFCFPDEEKHPIKVSAGIAFCTDAEADYEKALERADGALYQVKRSGKAKWKMWSD